MQKVYDIVIGSKLKEAKIVPDDYWGPLMAPNCDEKQIT